MKRTVTSVVISDTRTRIRVRLESDPCDPDQPIIFQYHQRDLLNQISLNPALVNCGLQPFETLRIYYNGVTWVADAEAIETKVSSNVP